MTTANQQIQGLLQAIPALQMPSGGELQFPFLDLKAQFSSLRPEIIAAVVSVLESQHFILGPEVEALEKDFASLADCQYAIGCASGSDALLLALMAQGVGAGDEVITTPFTFVATAGSIARLGARPVFVDIDRDTYNLDPAQIERAITPRTRGIIPVHLFGLPADMEPIVSIAKTHGLFVVEDAAQSICARYQGKLVGGIGTIGCFSFFPSKNLGAAGDGGMITTNDKQLAETMKTLRVHGSRTKYQCDLVGANSRLDALQAAILRVKLPHLAQWTARRQWNADHYRSLFHNQHVRDSVELPTVPAGCEHVYNQFVLRTSRRDPLREHLRRAGIPTEIYYPSPLHLQPAFAYLGYERGHLPEAELACEQVVALPIYPELGEERVKAVVQAIAGFFATKD
jgi:dTDP-4-amino-4,6-dideoxygalactose transaminase